MWIIYTKNPHVKMALIIDYDELKLILPLNHML